MNCIKCGKEVKDHLYLVKLGYSIPAKYCEQCRRDSYSHRRKKDIKRSLLQEFRNVRAKSPYLEMESYPEKDSDRYYIFRAGGREFGRRWAGVVYNEKYLFFVRKSLVEDGKIKKDAVVNVRKMVKTIYEEDGNVQKTNIYFVVEPSFKSARGVWVSLDSHYKTTDKGYGQDRNYSEHIETSHDVEVVAENTSTARSGRFWCKTTNLIVWGEDYIIDGIGVE